MKKLVSESLNEFNVRNIFGKKRFIPGDIVIRDQQGGRHDELFLYIEEKDTENAMKNRVLSIGSIGKNIDGKEYASLIFNPNAGIVIIRDGTFRHINRDERRMIEQAMEKESNQKYIDLAEEIAGVKIKL